jgi:hypothetical protein
MTSRAKVTLLVKLMLPMTSRSQILSTHNDLDEGRIVLYIRVGLVIELCQREEERTPAGDIHLLIRALERRARRIWSEGVEDVLAVVLVEEHEGHLLAERPLEDSVVLAAQKDEEE